MRPRALRLILSVALPLAAAGAMPVESFGEDFDFMHPGPPRTMRDFSWTYIDAPEPREIKVHDIITIIVDEKSEVMLNSRFNRQRQVTLKAELKEFIRLDDEFRLRPAAEDSQPTIDGNLNARIQSTGQAVDQESMRYRIAAMVVDVLPNGNIVLEARKVTRSNREVSEYSLTGIMRSNDVNRDNTALSEDIYNLNIVKTQRGKVHDSVKRPWGILLIDWFFPF